MLSIRLSRVGRRKSPRYRIIVLDKRKDPYGKYIELLGNYNPIAAEKPAFFYADRIKYWLSVGAQPSATVHNLLVKHKIIDAAKKRK